MFDPIIEKYFGREIKPKPDPYIVRHPLHASPFFKLNKLLPEPGIQKKAEANPSFLEQYIEDEKNKLPDYIKRKLAREKNNDLL